MLAADYREVLGSNPRGRTKEQDMSKKNDDGESDTLFQILEFLSFIAILVFVYFAFCRP